MPSKTLEPMGEFFDRRADGYEEHQFACVDGAHEMYAVTASLLPDSPGAELLDLGCGTGLELDRYFERNPSAAVTGIDLSRELTDQLLKKHADRAVQVILGSYFDEPFGISVYDAAVSVMSLHHFEKERKIPLYKKLKDSLKPGGIFVLTDYFAPDQAWEDRCFAENEQLRRENGIPDGVFCHFDTPLTIPHETEALLAGGFTSVETLAQWGNTAVLRAQ